MLLKSVTEILHNKAESRLGREPWTVPLSKVKRLTLNGPEPEVGLLPMDVWV